MRTGEWNTEAHRGAQRKFSATTLQATDGIGESRGNDTSGDREGGGGAAFLAMVVAPLGHDLPARVRLHVERHVRIRGHARAELRAEDFAPAVEAGQPVEDVHRDRASVHVAAKSRFHRMLHEHADLEYFALANAGRHLKAAEEHGQSDDSSRQAAEVTSTSTSPRRERPPENSASTASFCVPARRMRVAIPARPDCGPRWKVATCGRGLRGAKTYTALT